MESETPPTEQRFEFDCPERADGFIDGVRQGARLMGDDDPLNRIVKAELVQPAEPWSHSQSGKWIVIVRRWRDQTAK